LDELNKDFPDVHLIRANILMRLDRTEEAVQEFGFFLKEALDDPRSEQVRRIVARSAQTGLSSSSFLPR
jgi:predicted RNA polymerase sigma factor